MSVVNVISLVLTTIIVSLGVGCVVGWILSTSYGRRYEAERQEVVSMPAMSYGQVVPSRSAWVDAQRCVPVPGHLSHGYPGYQLVAVYAVPAGHQAPIWALPVIDGEVVHELPRGWS